MSFVNLVLFLIASSSFSFSLSLVSADLTAAFRFVIIYSFNDELTILIFEADLSCFSTLSSTTGSAFNDLVPDFLAAFIKDYSQ
jgi:hypothetical protein